MNTLTRPVNLPETLAEGDWCQRRPNTRRESMTDRIDHVAEAKVSLAGSGDGRNFATDASQNAIAHAILALVEQRRIANLISIEALQDVAEAKRRFLREQVEGRGVERLQGT